MKLTEDKLKPGDKVYCVLNHAIKGVITATSNYHGQWNYYIEVDDKKAFRTWIGVPSTCAVFLHWQLAKIYTEKH